MKRTYMLLRRICAATLLLGFTMSIAACKGTEEPSDPATQPTTDTVLDFEELEPAEETFGLEYYQPSPDEPPVHDGGDATTPSTPQQTQPETEPATEPVVEIVPPVTESTDPATQYEWYNSLTADEQVAFCNTFDDLGDFINWYNQVYDAYKALHPDVEVGGDGELNLGDIFGN